MSGCVRLCDCTRQSHGTGDVTARRSESVARWGGRWARGTLPPAVVFTFGCLWGGRASQRWHVGPGRGEGREGTLGQGPGSMARCVSPVPLPSWPCAASRTSFECRERGGTRWSFVPSTRWTVACASWLPPFCTRSFRLRKMLLGKWDLVKRMIPMTGYLRVIWRRRVARQWSATGHPPDESPCFMRSARVGAVDRGFPHRPLPGERSAGPRLRLISRGLRGPVGRTACGCVRVHCGNAGP
jgi:hypothetical protein